MLQIIETAGPGGAETMLATLSSGLIERGHTITCITAAGSWLPEELVRRGVGSTAIQSGGPLNAAFIAQVRRVIRSHGIQVVHVHLFDAAIYSALAAHLEGIPIVTTLHGQADVDRRGLKAWIKRMILSRSATCVVAVSDALRQELQASLSVPHARFRVIHNGVDWRPVPAPPAREKDWAPRLLAVGNIRQPKDYPTLLDALAIALRSHASIQLDVAGQPDRDGLYEALLQQAKNLDIQDHVTFHGFVSDTAPLLARADCFVLSSTREGFSLATVEAMLAGVPVVATRSGGPQEILRDGETGLLVPVGNSAALASAIIRILDNASLSRDFQERALADARARFTMSAMVTAYEVLYQELLGHG